MDADIETTVKQCEPCQQSRPLPAAAPLHPWKWPTRPWSRLHIDYAGPLDGKIFLVVIDAHSNWIEVFPVTSATAQSTIQSYVSCSHNLEFQSRSYQTIVHNSPQSVWKFLYI